MQLEVFEMIGKGGKRNCDIATKIKIYSTAVTTQ